MTLSIFKPIITLVILLFWSTWSLSGHPGTRADFHAPIGVMVDHTHKKGEWMLSYRYMNMDMNGNRDGTDRLAPSEILRGSENTGDYAVTPLRMPMQMHMLGAMYAPSDRLTLVAMIPFIDISMDHRTATGGAFTTKSSGLGDIKLGGLWSLVNNSQRHANVSMLLSLPTGSIDRTDVLPPVGGVGQLPFPMQLGSGSYDLIPGVTFSRFYNNYSWGAQARATLRLEDNDNGYRKGNQLDLTSWISRAINENYTASLRLAYMDKGNYDGVDTTSPIPVSNAAGLTVSTVDPNLRGGQKLDISVGVNSIFGQNRIAAEFAVPVYQNLNGPQLETDYMFTLGYQYAF